MKLQINNKPIDFSLENEKTLGDFYQSVQKKVCGEDHHIATIKVNGHYLDIDEHKKMPLNDIVSIEIEIFTSKQILVNNLIELANYLQRAITILEPNDGDDKPLSLISEQDKVHLKDGLAWISEALIVIGSANPELLATLLTGDNLEENAATIGIDDLKRLENELPHNPHLAQIRSLFSMLKQRLDILLHSIQDTTVNEENLPQKISAAIKITDQIRQDLGQVSELIQLGKDVQAFALIERAGANFRDYFSIVSFLKQHGIEELVSVEHDEAANLPQVNALFLEYFNNLTEAMENNDSISIADVCDYELPELLAVLPDALSKALELWQQRLDH